MIWIYNTAFIHLIRNIRYYPGQSSLKCIWKISLVELLGWFEVIQIKSLCTFPDRRAAFWACTGVLFLLVFGWLWYGFFDFWLLVCFWWWLGLVWVVGLLGWLGGGCLLFMVVFPGVFFVLGVGGCWLYLGLPRFLQPFSSASRGPPWRCLRWVLGVWFVWFSRTLPGRALVFHLPFHIICIGGLGICFCSWLWRPAFWFWLWILCLLRFLWGFSYIPVGGLGPICFFLLVEISPLICLFLCLRFLLWTLLWFCWWFLFCWFVFWL